MTDAATLRALPTITLARKGGIEVSLLALGARIASLLAPDRDGTRADVTLGHDEPSDYLTVGRYLGAICGRYANRIAGARFPMDGREVRLEPNEGEQQLHGGPEGFDLKIWTVTEQSADHVTFHLHSPAGEMGFPGAVEVTCTYRLVSDHALMLDMHATTSAPTHVNLASHPYFNLAGHGVGEVLDHSLKLYAAHYTPVDARNIPTGEIRAIAGTPFDFASARPIRKSMPGPNGFDHNFCLSAPLQAQHGEFLRPAAELTHPASGRSLKLWTTEIGLQVYTGAHYDGSQSGKGGVPYRKFPGIALETQKFPDSPNQPHFPSTRLDPGQVYRHVTLFDFTPH